MLFVLLSVLTAAQGQVPSGAQDGSPETVSRMTDAKAGKVLPVQLRARPAATSASSWELDGHWDAHDNISFQVGWQLLMKGNFALYAPDAPTDRSNVNYWFVQTEIRF